MQRDSHRYEAAPATLASYVTGFILSLALTVDAYLLVVNQTFTGPVLIAVIIGLAFAQFLVQLLFFLHLGREPKPRWKLFTFFFMILIVAIVVLGSLWIMSNLHYNMSPHEMDKYMIHQSQKGF